MRARLIVAVIGLLGVVALGILTPLRVLVTVVAAAAVGVLVLLWGIVEEQGLAATQLKRLQRRLKTLAEESPPAPAPPPPPPPVAAPDPFVDMSSTASALISGIEIDASRTRSDVVLVLQTFEPRLLFAGIRTAVLTGARLAAELGRPLRVVIIDPPDADASECLVALRDLVGSEPGLEHVAETLHLWDSSGPDRVFGPEDVWVATFWTTAYALRRLARAGRLDAARVVYLIQDFEPGFYSWGPLFAKALSTYDAGFQSLVNSSSLADYVTAQTSTVVPAERVFAPALDETALARAAADWRPAEDGQVRVLFYARPGKPRNMYAAGIEALRSWGRSLPEDGPGAVVHFAGEEIETDPVDLGPAVQVVHEGKLSYDDYYRLLRKVDVGLALMLSPHPGHLALELPMAGIPTVTNSFSGYRARWVDGLVLADPEPDALAAALSEAAELARGADRHLSRSLVVGLGTGVESAVAHVAAELRG